MSIKTNKFVRKPFYVDAVRVSEANMAEVAEWCGGKIVTPEEDSDEAVYISVPVFRPINDKQTQAKIGDWVLYSGTSFKVYTPKAFDKAFEKVKTLTKAQADEAGIKPPHEPKQKAKKRGPREIGTNVGGAIKNAQSGAGKAMREMAKGPKKETESVDIRRYMGPASEESEKVEWDIDNNRPMEETRRLEAMTHDEAVEDAIERTTQDKVEEEIIKSEAKLQDIPVEQAKEQVTEGLDSGIEFNGVPLTRKQVADIGRAAQEAETQPATASEAEALIQKALGTPLSTDNPPNAPDPIFDEKDKQHQQPG